MKLKSLVDPRACPETMQAPACIPEHGATSQISYGMPRMALYTILLEKFSESRR